MSSLETDLLNKVVVITGASSGIGQAAAVEFAKNGSKLVICGRNAVGLRETKEMCLEHGKDKISREDILEIIGDLEKPEECKKLIDETILKFSSLDVLVNNAGYLQKGSIETLSLDEYDKQMNVNVRSIFILTQAAIPHLIKTKGNVVNVSSINGIRSFAGILSYNMSKAALDQFTRCVALEMAPHSVRINSVNPGVIVTNIQKNAGMSDEEIQKFLEHSKSTHALGRVGTGEEVAKSIVFLASNNLAGFMTGVTLPIDGGRGLICPR